MWGEIYQVIQCMYFSRVEREIETGMEGHQIQYPMSYGLCNEGDTNEKEGSDLHMIKKVLMRYSRGWQIRKVATIYCKVYLCSSTMISLFKYYSKPLD